MKAKHQPSSGVRTALIYTRVSSDEQAREGISLDAQLAECRRYAARPGWVIGGERQDVLSGTRDDRREYQALLPDIRGLRAEGRAVVVVVAALDRFGRKLLERVRCREELKALGVPTHSVREGGGLGHRRECTGGRRRGGSPPTRRADPCLQPVYRRRRLAPCRTGALGLIGDQPLRKSDGWAHRIRCSRLTRLPCHTSAKRSTA